MEVAEKASWEGWPTEGKTMGFGKGQSNKDQCILFSVVFTPSPSSHHGSVWVLPVISLLLTNTVLPVRACLSI
jgi:hypothetical protein